MTEYACSLATKVMASAHAAKNGSLKLGTMSPMDRDLPQLSVSYVYGDPGKIRTSDLRFRKPSLYPPELQGRLS